MTVRAPYKPNTPDLVASSFVAAIGKRRRVTVHGDGSYVVVVQTDARVSRSMFLWWLRNGWLRETSRSRNRTTYERGDRYAEALAVEVLGARLDT
jgi:hypothetical protein